jgi:CIC family chloride channel protein
MAEHERIGDAATADGLAVAPSLGPALESVRAPREHPRVDARVVWLCGVSVAVAAGAGVMAELLTRLIGLITNLAFYGRVDRRASPRPRRTTWARGWSSSRCWARWWWG